MTRRRRGMGIGLTALAVVILATAIGFIQSRCPLSGIAFSPAGREFARLKNRTALPGQTDFDERVTLSALVAPGDDRGRWSQSRAAAVEGYVLEVKKAGIESANCFSFTRRDIHIHIAPRLDALPQECLVVELTPRIVDRARRQGLDWSASTLMQELVGHWCRFEGWLLFDTGHADESENTAPGRAGNWRATAWEIHPITGLSVIR